MAIIKKNESGVVGRIELSITSEYGSMEYGEKLRIKWVRGQRLNIYRRDDGTEGWDEARRDKRRSTTHGIRDTVIRWEKLIE